MTVSCLFSHSCCSKPRPSDNCRYYRDCCYLGYYLQDSRFIKGCAESKSANVLWLAFTRRHFILHVSNLPFHFIFVHVLCFYRIMMSMNVLQLAFELSPVSMSNQNCDKSILTHVFYLQVLSALLDGFSLITSYTEPCVIQVMRGLDKMALTNIISGCHPSSSRAS